MGCTLEMMPIDGDESAWHPIEFDAAMGAFVHEKSCHAVTVQCDQAAPVVEVDSTAGAFGKSVQRFLPPERDSRLDGFHAELPRGNSPVALALSMRHPLYIDAASPQASRGLAISGGNR